MKTIKIPLIEKEIQIYVGKEEWSKWQKQIKKFGCKDPILEEEYGHLGDGGGVTWGGFIWINKKDNVNTLFHELQHAMSAIFELIGADKEEEMRAYIAGHVSEKALKWMNEDNLS